MGSASCGYGLEEEWTWETVLEVFEKQNFMAIEG